MANLPAKDGTGATVYIKANGLGTNDASAYTVTNRIEDTSGTAINPATSTNQSVLIGHVDGIETLLTAIGGNVDGLEGFTDGLETSLAALLTELQAKADLAEIQPVSGPLTDAQVRATPLPVSGTVKALTGLSQPLTDTQLRATPINVAVSSAVPTGRTINTTTANLQATDAGSIIYYDNVADGTITIPVATIAALETVQIMAINTGKATVVAGESTTLRIPVHPNSPTVTFLARTEGRWATITVFNRGSEEFVMGGRLATT